MASHCEISIVIPVLNEAAGLAELIGRIQALQLAQVEVIVVDDGSSDGSAETALRAGANVIRHPYNIGNGAAVKSGIRAAQGRDKSLMDGDGQHKPAVFRNCSRETGNYHRVVGPCQRLEAPTPSQRCQRRIIAGFLRDAV